MYYVGKVYANAIYTPNFTSNLKWKHYTYSVIDFDSRTIATTRRLVYFLNKQVKSIAD